MLQVLTGIHMAWGQHSLVEAERALLSAALNDPLNEKFVLVPEDAIPLYPPQVLPNSIRCCSCRVPTV